jgi:hypothetical protein
MLVRLNGCAVVVDQVGESGAHVRGVGWYRCVADDGGRISMVRVDL